MEEVVFGIDFGTTNTVIAKVDKKENPALLELGDEGARDTTNPSVLSLELDQTGHRSNIISHTGHKAIELAAKFPEDLRYLQQFKNYAGSKFFEKTYIHRKEFRYPDIVYNYIYHCGLGEALENESRQIRLVIGRPVKFSGSEDDDSLPMERYLETFRRFGADHIHFVLEPVGGAFSFLRQLNDSATVLIADLGGGTSDFSILRYNVKKSGSFVEPVSNAGLSIAGSTFDRRIIRNVVLKYLGSGTTYRSWGKDLPAPRQYYSAVSNWHELSMLNTPERMKELNGIMRTAQKPELIAHLINLIQMSRGLEYFKAVSKVKSELSHETAATLSIEFEDFNISEKITRDQFEFWIAEELDMIEKTVSGVLASASFQPSDIDRVFLTGGTSLVPSVRNIFVRRFGEEKIMSGKEFHSVAEGLALVGLSNDISAWSFNTA